MGNLYWTDLREPVGWLNSWVVRALQLVEIVR
jgi:hypothetical protein